MHSRILSLSFSVSVNAKATVWLKQTASPQKREGAHRQESRGLIPAVEGTPAVLSSFLPIVPIVSKETSLPNCIHFSLEREWAEDVGGRERGAKMPASAPAAARAELRWRWSQGQLHGSVTAQ